MSGDAVALIRRAAAWYREQGVTSEAVLTDNGGAYRSSRWGTACDDLGLRHLRTRPYTPRTNGKAERFIQTMLRQWAEGVQATRMLTPSARPTTGGGSLRMGAAGRALAYRHQEARPVLGGGEAHPPGRDTPQPPYGLAVPPRGGRRPQPLAYAEVLPCERAEDAVAFTRRAVAWRPNPPSAQRPFVWAVAIAYEGRSEGIVQRLRIR